MAVKTFPHAVIYDGKFYPAGATIKVKEPKVEETAEPIQKKAVKNNDKGTSRKA